MMFHYRTTRNRYASYPRPKGCSFCTAIEPDHLQAETAHHTILTNRVMYDVWELRRVTDHLLVIPKRHVKGLGELTNAEKLDHINIIAEYELKGYNVYARGIGSLQRSVEHQHTHLIRTGSKQARGSLSIKKPYFLITF